MKLKVSNTGDLGHHEKALGQVLDEVEHGWLGLLVARRVHQHRAQILLIGKRAFRISAVQGVAFGEYY